MIEVFDFPQYSDEWWKVRLGVPTASRFKDILAKGKGITRHNYLLDLVGEIMTGKPAERYSNANMERGLELEEEARHLYAMITDTEPHKVGFILNAGIGASPDYLVGDKGMVEIKTRLPRLQIELLLDDKVPSEHTAQIQGQMAVAERDWVDFVSYCPGLKLFMKRVHRDDDYHSNLFGELREFIQERNQLLLRLRG